MDISCVMPLFISHICGPISYTFGSTKSWDNKVVRQKIKIFIYL